MKLTGGCGEPWFNATKREIIVNRQGGLPYIWIGNKKPDMACYGTLAGKQLRILRDAITRALGDKEAGEK